jgi:aryl-alcohol dehydrogenase-like predicted oxidoreductase
MTDTNYARVEKLTAWAEARGRKMNELAHAWLLAQPQVCSVISGATKLEQVLGNAKAADWSLGAEEVKEINTLLE